MKKFATAFAAVVFAGAVLRAQDTTIHVYTDMKVPLEAKVLKGAPYSAETVNEHLQALSDGNRIVRKTTGRVYRDSEGRVRREIDRASGSPEISITDPVAGVSWSLNPETHVAWKTASAAGATIMNLTALNESKAAETRRLELLPKVFEATGVGFAVRRGGSNETRSEETLPAKIVEGVIADGRRVTTTLAAGAIGNERPIAIVTEEWTSPELQVLVLTERTDPREGDDTYRLQNIVRSEPAAALFQVPADYTIRETGIRRFERQ